MKIISINGQAGTGKTTVAKVLLEKFENSAYISGDALVAVRPFGVNEKTDRLVIKNSSDKTPEEVAEIIKRKIA